MQMIHMMRTMQIPATSLTRLTRTALDAVEHRGEIVEILRYGRIVARLVPASATVVLADLPPAPSVVPAIEIPGETAGKS